MSKEIYINTSIGDVVDKLTILELKKKYILNKEKLLHIIKEFNNLIENLTIFNLDNVKNDLYYNILLYINEEIWMLTDKIKSFDDINNKEYSLTANNIFILNQKRFRLKTFFNTIYNSSLNEQKSYNETTCLIHIENVSEFLNKIPEINYLSIEYDTISFIFKEEKENDIIIKDIIKATNIIEYNSNHTYINNIILTNYTIDKNIYEIFENKPLKYIASGRLGDVIQFLSIINENFYKFGKKGILYITSKEQFSNRESFNKGLVNTYNDVSEVIKNQNYIKDFKIYHNEQYDIDLDRWRVLLEHKLYNVGNWYDIFKNIYNVEWGKHTWIDVEKNKLWENTIFINTTPYRFGGKNINFNRLHEYFNTENIVFISPDKEHYEDFIKKININIKYYKPNNFKELCSAILSCKLFIGSLSMILTIAHSGNINRVVNFSNGIDDNHNINLNKIWNNISYKL